MSKSEKLAVVRYEAASNVLVDEFINRFYDGVAEHYWIGYHVGDVLFVCDIHISMSDIVISMNSSITPEQLIEWYYNHVDDEKYDINLRSFIMNLPKAK